MIRYEYGDIRWRRRSRLPHLEAPNGLYFLTFNLADAIRRETLFRAARRRLDAIRDLGGAHATLPIDVEKQLNRQFRREIEAELDEGHGRGLFHDPCLAATVEDALKFFHHERYELGAWAIMPTHVHTVCQLRVGWNLDQVVHSWKSYTSSRINRMIGGSGRIWQPDYFDVLIRDTRHLDRAVAYVLDNPGKAGLEDWPCVGADGDVIGRLQ